VSYNRNNVKSVTAYIPSIASDGSVIAGMLYAPAPAEVVGVHVVTGGATVSTNWNLNIYKNASNTGSRIATTGSLAAIASYTGTDLTTSLTTTTALKKLAAGDVVLLELTSHGGTTTNSIVQLDYIFGYED